MTTLLFIILSSYVVTIGILIFGFTKMKTLSIYETVPKNTFSIVVPFRNESQNLPLLLETISHLNYPKDQFEVLLVDDDSDEAFELQKEYGKHPHGYGFYGFKVEGDVSTWNCSTSCD